MGANTEGRMAAELALALLDNADRSDHGPLVVQVQGFGMARVYLTETLRLHLWHADFMKKEVTAIHNHPWDWKSFVLCGKIQEQRYTKVCGAEGAEIVGNDKLNLYNKVIRPYIEYKIRPGPNAAVVDSQPAILREYSNCVYTCGDGYRGSAADIHQTSIFTNGTMTLFRRVPVTEDSEDFALSYATGMFVSAAPLEVYGELRAKILGQMMLRLTAVVLAKDFEPLPAGYFKDEASNVANFRKPDPLPAEGKSNGNA